MLNYTKGKWEVTKWASHKDIHVSLNEGSYMRFICNCGNPQADSLPTNPEAEANAFLISQAPAMVEFIKRFKEVFDYSTSDTWHTIIESGTQRTFGDVANEILSKLEGESKLEVSECKFFYHGYCLHDDAPKSDISCIGTINENWAGGGCGAWQDGSMKLNVGNLEIAFDLLCSKEK